MDAKQGFSCAGPVQFSAPGLVSFQSSANFADKARTIFSCVGQDAEPCGNLCSQAFGSFLQVVVRGEEVSGLVRNGPSPPTVKPHAPAG